MATNQILSQPNESKTLPVTHSVTQSVNPSMNLSNISLNSSSSSSSTSSPSTPQQSTLRFSDQTQQSLYLSVDQSIVARVRGFVFKRGVVRTIDPTLNQPLLHSIHSAPLPQQHPLQPNSLRAASAVFSSESDLSGSEPVIQSRSQSISYPAASLLDHSFAHTPLVDQSLTPVHLLTLPPPSPQSGSSIRSVSSSSSHSSNQSSARSSARSSYRSSYRSNQFIHPLLQSSTTPVLLKCFANTQPSDDQVTQLKFEFLAFQRLPWTNQVIDQLINRPLTILNHETEGLCLLYHDIGGVPLDSFIYGFGLKLDGALDNASSDSSINQSISHAISHLTSHSHHHVTHQLPWSTRKPVTLAEILRMSRALTQSLMQLHECNVIYKALHPGSILYNSSSDRSMFLEFHASSLLSRERPIIEELNQYADPSLLSYISPEQTGRMNRILDSRTDLYSLGVCLFELLTGAPPFASTDPMEVIHFHLAKACPDPVTVLASKSKFYNRASPLDQLPASERETLSCMSAIIQKLVSKQAEDRYQSAAGLYSDLEYCYELLTKPDLVRQTPRSISPHLAHRSVNEAPRTILESSHEDASSSDNSPSADALPIAPTISQQSATVNHMMNNNRATSLVMPGFKVGQTDVLSQFHVSQKLYGREEQVKVLLDAFNRISGSTLDSVDAPSQIARSRSPVGGMSQPGPTPKPEFVLIAGFSGIGKSSVVDEVQKPIVRQRGFFAKGKFDLYRRNHSVLLEALQGLLTQLLTQDVALWRARLLAGLGGDGAVMIAVMPVLEKLIGPQPSVTQPLNQSDADKRFTRTFLSLINCLAQAAHPLTIFCDDLQWSDLLSLQLIRAMLTQCTGHLLIIGAYRDNEVNAMHPLMRLIADLNEDESFNTTQMSMSSNGSAVVSQPVSHTNTIVLRPLQLPHVVELVIDSLRCSKDRALDLARLLMQRTQGNPFFINSLLNQFHADRLIWFDYRMGAWQWDIEQLRLANVSDDVVTLLCTQIKKLDSRIVDVLKFAACIGNSFTLSTLALVHCSDDQTLNQSPSSNPTRLITRRDEEETIWAVWQLANAGFIVPLNNQSDLFVVAEQFRLKLEASDVMRKYPSVILPSSQSATAALESNASNHPRNVQFRFAHDRIQQAASSLIDEREKQWIHLRIARLLAAHIAPSQLTHPSSRSSPSTEAAGSPTDTSSLEASPSAPEVIADSPTATLSHINFLTLDEHQIIEVVEHYNQGNCADLIDSPEEIRQIIGLELLAASKAKQSTAYASSVEYLRVALSLLNKLAKNADSASPFDFDYEMAVKIHLSLCECLLLTAQMEEADRLAKYALSFIFTTFDRVELLGIEQQIQKSAGEMVGATMTGLECLNLLDYPLAPIEEVRAAARDSERLFHEFDRIARGDRMTDRRMIAIFDVLVKLAPCAVGVSQPPFIFSSVIHGMVRLAADHGVTESTSFALSSYAHILWGEGKISLCYRAGSEAIRMLDSTNAPQSIRGKVMTTFHACSQFWIEPIYNAWSGLFANAELCAEHGDYEYQSYSLTYAQSLMFADGQPLERVAQKQRDMLVLFKRRANYFAIIYCRMYRFVVAKLAGEFEDDINILTLNERAPTHSRQPTAAPAPRVDDTPNAHIDDSTANLDLHEVLKDLERAKLSMCTMANLTCQCLLYYFERNFVRAAAAGEAGWHQFTNQGHGGANGLISNVRMLFYYCLTLLGMAPVNPIENDQEIDSEDGFQRLLNGAYIITGKKMHTPTFFTPDEGKRTSPSTPSRSVTVRSEVHRNLTVQVAADNNQSTAGANQTNVHAIDSIMGKVAEMQRWIGLWADNNPFNFGNKVALINAERLRVAMLAARVPNGRTTRPDLLLPALRMYDHAIHLSRVHGFFQEEALANELAGRFCTSINLRREAEGYLRSAYFGFQRWGCVLKMNQLKREFPVVFAPFSFVNGTSRTQPINQSMSQPVNPPTNQPINQTNPHLSQAATTASTFPTSLLQPEPRLSSGEHELVSAEPTVTSPALNIVESPSSLSYMLNNPDLAANQMVSGSKSKQPPFSMLGSAQAASTSPIHVTWDHIDIAAVMKACMAFSVEKDLNKLVRSLLWLVIQTAGATRGTLLLKTGETWAVELTVSVEDGHDMLSPGSDLGDTSNERSIQSSMPMTVFNLVCSTSSIVLLSGSELKQGAHADDPHLKSHSIKACLAMPINQQNKLTGILYLENDHSADSFTRTHLQILQVLSAQAALSIENARLYSRLQEYTQVLQLNNQELQREIVQRQEAQEDMRRAKEAAEKAAETKSAFLSNMSHEIRTPMNAVLGLTRLLQDTELTAEQSSYLQMITNSGKLLLTIINDVLDFSRIESNNLELEYRRFSLLECVENACHLCFDMASKKQLDLAYYVDRSVPPYVYGDSSRLQQILLNLLSNAVKFTPSKGQVVVTVKCTVIEDSEVDAVVKNQAYKAWHGMAPQSNALSMVMSQPSHNVTRARQPSLDLTQMLKPRTTTPQPSSRRLESTAFTLGERGHSSEGSTPVDLESAQARILSGRPSVISPPPVHSATPPSQTHQFVRLELSVRDTGLGISEETQSRLFKSFSQGDTSVVRRFGGTGLGLAISRRLALHMNGEMWCQSELGKGSTFHFTIQTAAVTQSIPPSVAQPLAHPITQPDVDTKLVMNPVNSVANASTIASTSPATSLHKLNALEIYRLNQRRVLVVADQVATRDTMVKLLGSYDMHVTSVSSLREAMQFAAIDSSVDQSDWCMPNGIVLDYQGCTHSPHHISIVDKLVAALAAKAEMVQFQRGGVGAVPTAPGRGPFCPLVVLLTTRLVSSEFEPQQDDFEFVKPTAQPHNTNESSDDETDFIEQSMTPTITQNRLLDPGAEESDTEFSTPASVMTSPILAAKGLENEVEMVNQLVLAKLSNLEHHQRREEHQQAVNQSADPVHSVKAPLIGRGTKVRTRPMQVSKAKVIKVGSAGASPSLRSRSPSLATNDEQYLSTSTESNVSRSTPSSTSLPQQSPLRGPSTMPADYLLLELTKPYKQHDLLSTLADHLPDEHGLRGLDRWQSRFSSSASQYGMDPASPSVPLTPDQPPGTDTRMKREQSDPMSHGTSVLPSIAPSPFFTASTDPHLHSEDLRLSPSSFSTTIGTTSPSFDSPLSLLSNGPSPALSSNGSAVMSPSLNSHLPLAARQIKNRMTAKRPSIAPIAGAYPLVVLLAEDNPVNSKMMKLFLKKLGYECDVAASGEEVLALAEERVRLAPKKPVFDVCLMDVNMGEMGGIECTRILRSLPYGVRPFVIACTANASMESKDKCLGAGMNSFLPKPVILEELAKQLIMAHRTITAYDQSHETSN